MAGLTQDKRTRKWLVPFRYGKQQFLVSSKTTDKKEAGRFKGRIEDTLKYLERGVISMPPDADPKTFIISSGKQARKLVLKAKALSTFGEICQSYLADQPHKAGNTLCGERVHVRHLTELLGESSRLQSIGVEHLQGYVATRSKTKLRGRPISGKTIRKELVTFRQIWGWSRRRNYVNGECPLINDDRKWAVDVPKPAEKERFQTWAEIESQVNRGGLSDDQVRELWASLFLDNDQVMELLNYVQANAAHAFIYPMFVFTAYTGARRSEILRSRIDDCDFTTKKVKIREKKRKKDKSGSFRFVDLHPRLAEVLTGWFAQHPGGPFTITAPLAMARRKTRSSFSEMTGHEAHHHFKKTLDKSQWSVVRGFHVLRHSFGANLARAGVSRDQIGEWMGHSTEEMKTHYQHLFPQDGASQIALLK